MTDHHAISRSQPRGGSSDWSQNRSHNRHHYQHSDSPYPNNGNQSQRRNRDDRNNERFRNSYSNHPTQGVRTGQYHNNTSSPINQHEKKFLPLPPPPLPPMLTMPLSPNLRTKAAVKDFENGGFSRNDDNLEDFDHHDS
jgi:hypothetical protein